MSANEIAAKVEKYERLAVEGVALGDKWEWLAKRILDSLMASEGKRIAAEARCKRLEASLEETVHCLTFAFEEGALPHETIIGLCVDPYGMLKDAKRTLEDKP